MSGWALGRLRRVGRSARHGADALDLSFGVRTVAERVQEVARIEADGLGDLEELDDVEAAPAVLVLA